MPPQLAAGGRSPRPRKVRPASVSRMYPKLCDTDTITGDATLGKMWVRRMRTGPAPTLRDA
jgi:hypothetical protein